MSARKRLAWEGHLIEVRDGRRNRAVTFTDRRKENSRRACRGHRKEEA